MLKQTTVTQDVDDQAYTESQQQHQNMFLSINEKHYYHNLNQKWMKSSEPPNKDEVNKF
jgi:hypothetical protein